MKSAYRALKDHAKARGIQFTITFKYFERFAIVTKYLCKTGNTGDSLTVDRRDNLQGYVPGNIQPMTRSKNSEKLARSDARRMRCGYKWVDESPEDFIEDGEHQKEREAA